MSNYALGAGLQGFVQGATDFFKMYMTFQQMQAEKNYKDKLLNLREQESQFERGYKEKSLGLQAQQLQSEADYRKQQAELAKQKLDWQKQFGEKELDLKRNQMLLQQKAKELEAERKDPIEYANNLIKAGNSLFQMAKDQVAKLTGNQIVLDPNALNNAQQFDLYVSQLQSLKTGGKDPQKDMYIDQVIQNMTKAFQYVQLGSDLLARHSMEGLGFNVNEPSPSPKPKPSSDNFYLNILKKIQKRNQGREKPEMSTVRESYEEKKNALLENLKNKQNLFSLF